jgi:hypothetical protein
MSDDALRWASFSSAFSIVLSLAGDRIAELGCAPVGEWQIVIATSSNEQHGYKQGAWASADACPGPSRNLARNLGAAFPISRRREISKPIEKTEGFLPVIVGLRAERAIADGRSHGPAWYRRKRPTKGGTNTGAVRCVYRAGKGAPWRAYARASLESFQRPVPMLR